MLRIRTNWSIKSSFSEKKENFNILWAKEFPKTFSKQANTYIKLKFTVKASAVKKKTQKLLMKRKFFELSHFSKQTTE